MTSYYRVYSNESTAAEHVETLDQAQARAEELAAKHPGRAFEILRCVGISQTSNASTFWMDGEEPPEELRYRTLDVGEPVRLGDEWLNRGKWVPRTVMFGNPLLPHHAPHRRPL